MCQTPPLSTTAGRWSSSAGRSNRRAMRSSTLGAQPDQLCAGRHVLQVVRDRSPTEITVFGYTDSVGSAQYNLVLSAQRARAAAKMLLQIDPTLPIDVKYFGDKYPLVPSPRGVPEPRNRRAEIVIL